MDKKKIASSAAVIGVSAAVGAGLGILFAPRKGSETRAILKNKIMEFGSHIKKIDSKTLKTRFETKLKNLEKEIDSLENEKTLKEAKKKAINVKKKSEELLELAIKKGNEDLKITAQEVRDRAIEIASVVIEKLNK